MSDDRPTVLLLPDPHPAERIFHPADRAALGTRFDVRELRADQLADHLADAFAIVGQPDLPREVLARAPRLRAVLNIEGNFYPNVDYAALFDRGVHVLGCGPAYADAVAEYALGLALDLARGISREDRAFRAGAERYVAAGNADAVLLRGASVGLIGFGNLGRALLPLLQAFRPEIRVFDPWLPANTLRRAGVTASTLDEVLTTSQVLFVLATVTGESDQLLGARELHRLRDGARLVLVSRAPIVDYDALLAQVAAGRLLAGVDVWPDEPVPPDHAARSLDGLVLSAHRAGGIPQAFLEIGGMVLDDLTLIAAGLPPVRMQVASREVVGRYRNRPVNVTLLPCAAVLFDCDGVLVDSDASVVSAWSRWAREHGLDADEVVAVVHGRRSADTVARLVDEPRRAQSLALIDRYEIEDARQVHAIAGARSLTASMPARSWAVVTSATTPLAVARLAAAGIAPPSVLVTADDVTRGKPDPEGYATAARLLGVAASATVVLEDALAGIHAARTAGVGAVIGVGRHELDGAADLVVADLHGLRWTGEGLLVP